jgi:hypothetical protein
MLHWNGDVPPVIATAALYGFPTVPFGSVWVVEMTRNGLTVKDSEALFEGSAMDVAVTVTCCAPLRLVVGVLYIANEPAAELRDPAPLRLQFTPFALASFATVAVTLTVDP